MKITYLGGEEDDTTKMPDMKAHLYESIQTFMDVLKIYDASFYLAISIPEGESVSLTGAQRFKSSKEMAVLFDYFEKKLLNVFKLKIVPDEESLEEELPEEESKD